MLAIEDYAFPFGLCFSRPIMLKIMLAYCINSGTRSYPNSLKKQKKRPQVAHPLWDHVHNSLTWRKNFARTGCVGQKIWREPRFSGLFVLRSKSWRPCEGCLLGCSCAGLPIFQLQIARALLLPQKVSEIAFSIFFLFFFFSIFLRTVF